MKLRNKKTGAIYDVFLREREVGGYPCIIVCDKKAYMQSKTKFGVTNYVLDEYSSLAELNEDWEDYEPVEPFFSEKICKAIRAWWDMQDNPFKAASVYCDKKKDLDGFYHWRIFGYIREGEQKESTDLCFRTKKLYEFKDFKDYTKQELCGEEQENAKN